MSYFDPIYFDELDFVVAAEEPTEEPTEEEVDATGMSVEDTRMVSLAIASQSRYYHQKGTMYALRCLCDPDQSVLQSLPDGTAILASHGRIVSISLDNYLYLIQNYPGYWELVE